MKRGVATFLLGGILCMFAKNGVIQLTGAQIPAGAYGGEFPYRSNAEDLFRMGFDLYASECGYICDQTPWQHLQLKPTVRVVAKICMREGGGHTMFALEPRDRLVVAYDKD